MSTEVHGLAAFYGSRGGETAARLLAARMAALWPRLPGLSVLGLGWTAPYMGLWPEAYRRVALVPGHLNGSHERHVTACPTLLAEEENLPFADRSFDRVVLVHGLEAAENTRRLLREVWRVLNDDGRLMLVVPNRVGMWAHMDRTPFGHGQPYSRGQIERLLARHLFRAERREAALFVPPYGLRWIGSVAPSVEKTGRLLCPRIAGVFIVEAEKDLFSALPAGAVAVRRRVLVNGAG
ncbi:class I SAM-dependent methyltransferase [Falsiroseomonas oryziterrae]|uniref:class I SAM-dependent methyltransferase n=1 Tax=Falsiroseomonas oryziterrae TaxID=2911368 RepID=UPI001F15F674|nr:class I SAM-dependent methyltransferase [Roseomonas sp. NPKOSM-4]